MISASYAVSDVDSKTVYVIDGFIRPMTQDDFQRIIKQQERSQRLNKTKISFQWKGDLFSVPMNLVPKYLEEMKNDPENLQIMMEISLRYSQKIKEMREEQ